MSPSLGPPPGGEVRLGRTALSREELRRVEVMSRVRSGELSLRQASELLGLSYRQTRRIWAKYREGGAEALRHGNCGRRSNRAQPEAFRRRVLGLVAKHYGGEAESRLGPTLAAEHLAAEHGLEVDAETLRRWMLEAGLWERRRRRKRHRQRRARKAHFGELVQMDGSFYEWLPGRGRRDCLLNLVDDATGTSLCRLGAEETTWLAADGLRAWVEHYGVPRALYVDWKNVYHRPATAQERERGEVPLSQFGRMCQKLGIELIGASSPQAKGRVERAHGVHQDRLAKKLRLKKIGTLEEANRYLETEYLAEHNRRFARPPAEAVDFHWEAPEDLDRVFCLEEERVLAEDWVVRYHNRLLQVKPGVVAGLAPGKRVSVCEYRDGSLHLFWGLQELDWREVEVRPATPAPAPPPSRRNRPWEPPADHPWRRGWNLSPPAPPKKSSGSAEGERGSPLPPDPHPPRGHFYRGKNGDISKEV
jgi:transposase